MARNKAQQRTRAKRMAEKEQRKRQAKMRKIRIAATVLAVAGIGLGMFFLFKGDGTTAPAASGIQSTMPCAASGPGSERTCYAAPPPTVINEENTYTATIETSMGEIVIALEAKKAPKTVNNFVFLARQGFFNGLTFHRVIPGFMIQGGDPAGNGTGGPGYQFEDEVSLEDSFDRPGLLAMANSGANTNGSQFFVTVGEAAHLNGKHTLFGQVTSGMDVVEKIVNVERDDGDKPLEDVVMTAVRIDEV